MFKFWKRNKSLEARISAIEKQMEQLEKEFAQLRIFYVKSKNLD